MSEMEKKNEGTPKLSARSPKGAFSPIIIKSSLQPDNEVVRLKQEKARDAFLKREAAALGMADNFPGDAMRTPLLFVDPLFDPILLMFPKENIKELYRRLRHYYSYLLLLD